MTRRDEKKLLPEVLPAPSTERPSGSPRQRTLGQMNRLLAMAATGAAMGACQKPAPEPEGAKVITVPQPKESAESTPSGTPDTALPPRASATATEPDPSAQNPVEPPTGYAVVDPMPPPARCAGLANTVKASTKWKSATQLQVDLAKPSMASASYDAKDMPQVYGGTLKSKKISATHVTLVIELPAGSTYVSVSVAATCPAGNQHVSISISNANGTALAKSTPLSVQLGDSW